MDDRLQPRHDAGNLLARTRAWRRVMTMLVRAFLTFARLLALVAIFGITYAVYAMHLPVGWCIALIVLWFLVFGSLFPKAPA